MAILIQGGLTPLVIARYLVIARVLGPSRYGTLAILTALGGILSSVQKLGLGVAGARETARAKDPNNVSEVVSVLLVLRYLTVVPLIIFLVLVAGPGAGDFYELPNFDRLVRFYALTVVALAPHDILIAVVSGLQRFRFSIWAKAAYEVILTILSIVFVLKWEIPGLLIAQAISGAFFSFVLGAAIHKHASLLSLPSRAQWWKLTKTLLPPSLFAYGVRTAQTMVTQGAILVAAAVVPRPVVGGVRLAIQIGGQFSNILSPAVSVTLPRATRLMHDSGIESVMPALRVGFRRIMLIASGLGFVAIVVLPMAASLLFGSEFEGVADGARLFVVHSILGFGASIIFGGLHLPLGRDRSWLLSYVEAAIVSVIATLFIADQIPTVAGAVCGILVAGTLLFVLAFVSLPREVRAELMAEGTIDPLLLVMLPLMVVGILAPYAALSIAVLTIAAAVIIRLVYLEYRVLT